MKVKWSSKCVNAGKKDELLERTISCTDNTKNKNDNIHKMNFKKSDDQKKIDKAKFKKGIILMIIFG